jgi:hypothetical protein
VPNFPVEEPIADPEAFLRGLGLPTTGPENDMARETLAGHAALMDAVWEQEMHRRGQALEAYLNTPETEGGPGPATDDETARPSPFSALAGFKTGADEVE